MTLRRKVLLIHAATLAVLVAGLYFAGSAILRSGFEAVENRESRLNVERAREAVQLSVDTLRLRLADWAAWDDAYEFVANPEDADFIAANLSQQTILDLRINALVFVNSEEKIVCTRGGDFDAGAEAEVPASFLELLKPGSPFLRHPDVEHSIGAILLLPEGPVVIASRPITTSLHDRPSRGSLVWMRWLGEQRVKEIAESTHLQVSLAPLQRQLPAGHEWTQAAAALSDGSGEVHLAPLSDDAIAGFTMLRDHDGRPAMLLRVDMPREVTRQGRASVRTLLAAILVAGFVFGAVVLAMIELQILSRMVDMSRRVARIGHGADFSERIPEAGTDELGTLAVDVNSMLSRLETTANQIRESERRFQELADTAPVLIWMCDAEGKTTYVNRRWLEFTGRALGDELGAGWMSGVHADDLPVIQDNLKSAFEAREAFQMEFRIRRADGEYRWITDIGIPREIDEEFAGYIGSAIDISDRMELERDLVVAREDALAASAVKSQFLANMSHEIRTPLNGIIGLSALALKTPLTPEQKHYLASIHASGQNLLTIINSVLDLSKIEAGKVEIEQIPFRLRRCIEDTLLPVRPAILGKRLAFDLRIADDVPDMLVGDPVRLRQIVTNLLGNALKFTEKGRVALSVTANARAPEAVRLRFAVSDTGIGIPADKIGKVFEAFTQADGSTSRRFGGTGLGLTISSHLVQLMGGKLLVDSEVGRGSTFHFEVRLPIAREVPALVEAVAGEEEDSAEPVRPLRILLAEDNEVNLLVARKMLEGMGHAVSCAADGRQALEALTRGGFELALMDVQMPEMDGYEVVRRLREAEEIGGRKRLPVIALTAHAMKGDAEKSLEAGMDDHVTKPLSEKVLAAAIRRHAPPPAPAAGPQPAAAAPPPERASASPSPDPPPSTAPFDAARLLEQLGDDRDLARDIARIFISQLPAQTEALQARAKERDAAGIEHAAHKIKGSVAQMAADRAASTAAAIEDLARRGKPVEAAACVPDLLLELGRVKEALAEFLERPPGVQATPPAGR